MTRPTKPSRDNSLLDIFAIPLALGALTVFGLLAALLGQGDLWRYLSWAALTTPIGVIIRHVAFAGDVATERISGPRSMRRDFWRM
jgi:hypothetical protein